MKISIRTLLACLLISTGAFAQNGKPIIQSGNVTPGHAPVWITSGVEGDGGSASDSPITSFGTTGPICSLSARQASGAYNQFCIQAFTNSPAVISLQNWGSAPAESIQFNINGATQGFPTVSPLPTVIGDFTCFYTTGGGLTDCGIAPTTLPLTVTTSPVNGGTTNCLLYDPNNKLGCLATANSSILATNGTGVPAYGTALPNGIMATTQSGGDSSTKVATDAFVAAAITNNCITLGGFLVGTGSASQCSTVSGSDAILQGFANFYTPNAVWNNTPGSGALPTLHEMAAGSSTNPITAITPTVGISRYEATTVDTEGGQNAALLVNLLSQNTSAASQSAQGNAIRVYAQQLTGGTGDEVGIYSSCVTATGVRASDNHAFGCFGIFTAAERTTNPATTLGANFVVQNNSGVDCPYSSFTPGGTTCGDIGAFIQADGTNLHSAGVLLYSNSGQFDCGYCIYSGAVKTSAFKSPGFVVSAAGNVAIGTTSGSSSLSLGMGSANTGTINFLNQSAAVIGYIQQDTTDGNMTFDVNGSGPALTLAFNSGNATFSSTTSSSSTTTGSGIFGGGIGVAGAGYFGGLINAAGTITGTELIPSGSSAPTVGAYLPAAGRLGLAGTTIEMFSGATDVLDYGVTTASVVTVPGAFTSGGVIIGSSLVSGAPTGGSEGAGTVNAAGAYYANGSKGVTCSGALTAVSSITIKDGIITAAAGTGGTCS
jgi:hypothetical protein